MNSRGSSGKSDRYASIVSVVSRSPVKVRYARFSTLCFAKSAVYNNRVDSITLLIESRCSAVWITVATLLIIIQFHKTELQNTARSVYSQRSPVRISARNYETATDGVSSRPLSGFANRSLTRNTSCRACGNALVILYQLLILRPGAIPRRISIMLPRGVLHIHRAAGCTDRIVSYYA